MKQELKTKWLAALRSDQYTQCKGSLEKSNSDGSVSHCCLGVLNVVNGKSNEEEIYSPLDYLLSSNVGIPNSTMRSKLANMNDGRQGEAPHSFAQIADYIDENLEVEVEGVVAVDEPTFDAGYAA